MKETKYAGTQTEKNLMAAFAGESEARNKYTYFASKAKKEGFEQIAALFLKTADNEKEHAKLWFKELNGIGDTAENLLSAAEGENYEWTDMYDALPKLPMRKVSMSWRSVSAWSPPLKSTTRSATVPCCTMWRWRRSSPRARSRCGSAATAVTSSWARRPRRFAPPATIPRAILKFTRRIIKERKGESSWSRSFYICKHCGNIIAKVKDTGVPVICCGEPMSEIVPGTTDASVEKHAPSGRWKTASSMSRSAPWSIPCCRSTTSSGCPSTPSRQPAQGTASRRKAGGLLRSLRGR